MLALTDDIRSNMDKKNVANIVLISTTITKGGGLPSYSAVWRSQLPENSKSAGPPARALVTSTGLGKPCERSNIF